MPSTTKDLKGNLQHWVWISHQIDETIYSTAAFMLKRRWHPQKTVTLSFTICLLYFNWHSLFHEFVFKYILYKYLISSEWKSVSNLRVQTSSLRHFRLLSGDRRSRRHNVGNIWSELWGADIGHACCPEACSHIWAQGMRSIKNYAHLTLHNTIRISLISNVRSWNLKNFNLRLFSSY